MIDKQYMSARFAAAQVRVFPAAKSPSTLELLCERRSAPEHLFRLSFRCFGVGRADCDYPAGK